MFSIKYEAFYTKRPSENYPPLTIDPKCSRIFLFKNQTDTNQQQQKPRNMHHLWTYPSATAMIFLRSCRILKRINLLVLLNKMKKEAKRKRRDAQTLSRKNLAFKAHRTMVQARRRGHTYYLTTRIARWGSDGTAKR